MQTDNRDNYQARPAVFVDRDGTINEQMGYVNHPSRFVLLPGTAQAIRLLNDNGFYVIVVSNQSGVARGYFPVSLLDEINALMKRKLAEAGAHIDAIYYCPHYPSGVVKRYTMKCKCRKPGIGLIEKARKDLNIDMSRSYVIGDTCSDLEMGQNAGIPGVLVKTGYGLGELKYVLPQKRVCPAYIAEDLLDAVHYIVSHSK